MHRKTAIDTLLPISAAIYKFVKKDLHRQCLQIVATGQVVTDLEERISGAEKALAEHQALMVPFTVPIKELSTAIYKISVEIQKVFRRQKNLRSDYERYNVTGNPRLAKAHAAYEELLRKGDELVAKKRAMSKELDDLMKRRELVKASSYGPRKRCNYGIWNHTLESKLEKLKARRGIDVHEKNMAANIAKYDDFIKEEDIPSISDCILSAVTNEIGRTIFDQLGDSMQEEYIMNVLELIDTDFEFRPFEFTKGEHIEEDEDGVKFIDFDKFEAKKVREDFFYLLGRHIGNMAKGEVIKVKERFYTHEEYMDENTEEGLATAAKITDLPLGEKPAVEWGELSRQLSSRKSDMEEDILDLCGKGDSYFTRIEKPRAKAEFDRVLDLVIDMYEDRVMKQERGVDHF
ncbi:MAG: hypothetical protein J6Y62_05735, partial [Clostridia bacterium]|nr:hypothetical protein [Clostridia bacterium]